jgi:ABC-2 type transport system permease protein
MTITPIVAMIRKDLQLFFGDRRSVIVSFVVPIAVASFFGSLFSTRPRDTVIRVTVLIADQDQSPISKNFLASAQGDASLNVLTTTADEARDSVRQGRNPVAVVIPQGFGQAAGAAFFGSGPKPSLDILYDPSRAMEFQAVRGIMTWHVIGAVTKGALGEGFPRMSLPYTVHEEAMGAANKSYNSYAHAFAGMGIQFLLFAAANLGVEMLLERQRGLWKRLRSAPVSKIMLLGGKAASGTIIALMTLLVSFGFAMVVFHVRIEGSLIGFLGVSLACSLMASTFGLLVAALGKTPGTARGVTSLAVLGMVMLGGAWIPTFIFPPWLQTATLVVPARWAVDGLDAMTWRGLGPGGAVLPVAMLLLFAAAFAAVAVARFRWEEV